MTNYVRVLAVAIVALLLVSDGVAFGADGAVRGIWYETAGIQNIAKQIGKFKRLGITRVHIMATSSIFDLRRQALLKACAKEPSCEARAYVFAFDKWPRAKEKRLAAFIDAMQKEQIQVIVTIWPEPNIHYINSLTRLSDFMKRHRIDALELEDEENWTKRFMSNNFANLTEAANSLISTLRNEMPAVKIGVTPAPRDFKAAAFRNDHLMYAADFISLQTYQPACFSDPEKPCEMDKLSGEYGPGKMQIRAIDLIRRIGLQDKPLILGLPAFDQATPTTTGEINMFKAAKAAICEPAHTAAPVHVIGYTYWSAENIKRGSRDQPYAVHFLEQCRIRAIAEHCKEDDTDIAGELLEACPGLKGKPLHKRD